MPVKETDPAATSLEGAFAEAMAGPAKPRDVPAPPPVDREAPHGRDDAGEPLAPYGLNKDGSVRRSPAGRPRKDKDDAARTVAAQPAAADPDKAGQQPEGRDFSAALMDAGETIWFGGSIVAKVGPQVPILGRFVPGKKLAATMAVFDAERPRLAAALNLAAQHDARARRLATRLADGDAGWALSVMFMVAPFAGAVASVWQGDKALADRELPALAELVKHNEAAMDRMLERITRQMQAAQMMAAQQAMEAAAAAEAAGEVPAGV